MIVYLANLFIWISTTSIWTFLIFLSQLKLIWKYKISYFSSPKTINYPDCVKDPKYGKSKFVDIETTKGYKTDKLILRMHYVTNGNPQHPTMLFIHGFPEFWYSWRYQLEEFKNTHRVLAIDLRGYGLTDKPKNVEDYQLKHLVNDIKGFLTALEIRSVVLLAHDWGGAVAWNFEKAHPEMVEKYISLNIPEGTAFQAVIRRSLSQFLKSWYIFFFQVPFFPEWVLSRLDMRGIGLVFTSNESGLQKTKFSEDEVKSFKANMAQPGALTAAINYYRAAFRFKWGRQERPVNKRMEAGRYMLIFGEMDNAISIECAHETKKFVPNIELKLLPGLSHWVQQDDPFLVNRLIRDFIDS